MQQLVKDGHLTQLSDLCLNLTVEPTHYPNFEGPWRAVPWLLRVELEED